MFLKYLAPLYEPIKFIRNKFVKGQNTVGKVRVDVGRVKSYKSLAKSEAKRAKGGGGEPPPPAAKTKSYVHLMRLAHSICEEPELTPSTRAT